MKKLSIGMRLTLWYFAIFLLAEFVFRGRDVAHPAEEPVGHC